MPFALAAAVLVVATVLVAVLGVGAVRMRRELWRTWDEEHVEALDVVEGVGLLQLDFGTIEEVNVAAFDGSYEGSACEREQTTHGAYQLGTCSQRGAA